MAHANAKRGRLHVRESVRVSVLKGQMLIAEQPLGDRAECVAAMSRVAKFEGNVEVETKKSKGSRNRGLEKPPVLASQPTKHLQTRSDGRQLINIVVDPTFSRCVDEAAVLRPAAKKCAVDRAGGPGRG